MSPEYVVLKTPVKIGDYDRVPEFSSKMVKGEEYLLVTRDCKFFLTDGKGGYIEFKTINSGITLDEVTQKINALDTKLSGDITTLESAVTALGLDFDGYITRAEYDNHVNGFNDLVSRMDDVELDAKHTNRTTIDKFSEDASGNPLFDGKKIVADFDTSGLEAEIAALGARSVVGSKLKTGLFKPPAKITGGVSVGIVKMGVKISGDFDFNADGTVTLPKGSYYKVRGALRFATVNASGYGSYMIRNFTDALNVGISATINSFSYWEGQQEAVAYIDATKKDINVGIYITGVANATGAEITDGFTFLDIQEVNRTTIIDPCENGKNINFEYGEFRMSADQTNLSTTNTLINLNTVKTGNMTLTNNKVTLKAGKTYELTSSLLINGTYMDYGIYDETNSAFITNGYVMAANYANSISNQPVAKRIYTPSTDIEISLRAFPGNMGSILYVYSHWTYLIIEEIAQPYYFNYYKDSIASTVLFSGTAGDKTTVFTLTDDITKYEKLIIYATCLIGTTKREKTSIVVNVKDIVIGSGDYEFLIGGFATTTYNYFIEVGFSTNKTFKIGNLTAVGWTNPMIYKIEGIGYTYDNPYQDIITTSPDAALADATVDADITSIWSGVGL